MTTSTPTDSTKRLTLVYRITSAAQQTRLLAEGQWVASAHSDVLAERDELQRRVNSMEQEIERLQQRLINVNGYHQAWAAHAQELEKQLEAVGAGGVEPLRRAKHPHQIVEPVSGVRCKIIENCKSCQYCAGRQGCTLAQKEFDNKQRPDVPPDWCPLPLYSRQAAAQELPVPTQEPQMLTAYSIQRFPSLEFQRWLKRQIPSGTVIGDSEYWASTLWEFMRHEVLRLSALQSDAPQPPAPAQKSDSLLHDEDLLEQLYWDFDHESSKGGQDRLVFKGKLRFYAEHVASKATAP